MVPLPAMIGWTIDELGKFEQEILQVLYEMRALRWKHIFLERGIRLRGDIMGKLKTTCWASHTLNPIDMYQLDALDFLALGITDQYLVDRMVKSLAKRAISGPMVRF